MNNYLNYKNKKYGHIVITDIVLKGSNFETAICKCECGDTFEVTNRSFSKVINGITTTCGNCYNGIPIKDFIGKRYGHIVITDCKLGVSSKRRKAKTAICKCECGDTFEVPINRVNRFGITTTCGNCYNGIPLKDFIGKRYGHIVITDCKLGVFKSSKKQKIAEYTCDCGNTFEKSLSQSFHNLGNKSYCGNCYDGIPRENYIGKVFGNFTILDIKKEIRNNQHYQAVLKCICGNTFERPLNVIIRKFKSNNNLYCGDCINGIPLKDFIGKRYGFLTITGFEIKKDHKYAVCKCDCGNECYRKTLELGKLSSCGNCYKGISYSSYIGQKIGYLTIIDIFKKDNTFFKCKCDCGNICIRAASSIIKTKQKYNSCGNCYDGIPKNNYVGKYYGIYKILNINNGKTLLENKYTKEIKQTNLSDFFKFKYILKNRDYLRYLKNISFGKLRVVTVAVGFFDDSTWHCKCECGNELDVSEKDLYSGTVTECAECRRLCY